MNTPIRRVAVLRGDPLPEDRHVALSLRAIVGVFGIGLTWISVLILALILAPTSVPENEADVERPHRKASSVLELSSDIDPNGPPPDHTRERKAHDVPAVSLAYLDHIEGLIFKYEKRIKKWRIGEPVMHASLSITEAKLDDMDTDLDRYRPLAANDPNLKRALGQVEEAVGFYRLAVARYVIYAQTGSGKALVDSQRYLKLARSHKDAGLDDLKHVTPKRATREDFTSVPR